MGVKCCYSSRQYNLENIDTIDKLLIIVSEHIKRILLILEDYSNNSYDNKELKLKDFHYYVKLQTVLINLKMISEEYRKANLEYTRDPLLNLEEGESKALALLKKGIFIKLEKIDAICTFKKFNLEKTILYLEDVLNTEQKKAMTDLIYLDSKMMERILENVK